MDEPVTSEVEVYDPAYEAHRMKITGKTWTAVAEAYGYPTASAARVAVQVYLSRAATELNREQKLERLQVQLDRYDEVLSAYWMAMKLGEEKAATVVLATLRQIDKLLKLDQPDSDTGVTRTVVIAGTEEEYLAGLRAVMDG